MTSFCTLRFPNGESGADVYDRMTLFEDHLVRDMIIGQWLLACSPVAGNHARSHAKVSCWTVCIHRDRIRTKVSCWTVCIHRDRIRTKVSCWTVCIHRDRIRTSDMIEGSGET